MAKAKRHSDLAPPALHRWMAGVEFGVRQMNNNLEPLATVFMPLLPRGSQCPTPTSHVRRQICQHLRVLPENVPTLPLVPGVMMRL
jgi:hypothetical protein